ncbi:MAG: hypothetical protein IJ328_00255 [Muribaculaceae bacterium]|nr:hypothetical protein [Muribaculaceae bacterium]
MKKLIGYILLLLISAGCVHSVDERLVQVSELADCNNVDSAAIVLQNIATDSLNEHNRRYYDLMSIKVRDTSCQDIKGDTVITELIRYFEDEGSLPERAEAYYYGGRVYREMGDLPQSLEYFQKALKALDVNNIHTRLKGKIYSQMGQIYFDVQMYEQAIPKFQIAVDYNKMFCDSIDLITNYKILSSIYFKTNNADSTLKYLGKALDISKRITDSSEYEIEIRNSIIDSHIKFGNHHLARKEYNRLDSIKSLYSNCNDDFLTCTEISMSMINCDYYKAESLAKQLSESTSVHSRLFAYGILKDIAKQKYNSTELYKYFDKYEKCMDSINTQASREAIIYQNSCFNYSLRERENHKLKMDRKRIITHTFFIILVLFITISITLYAYRSIRKENVQLNETNKKLDSENEIIKSEKDELLSTQEKLRIELLQQLDKITLLEKNNESLKKHISEKDISNEILQKINDRISSIDTENIDVDFKIINSNAYITLRNGVNQEKGISDNQVWEELNYTVNEIYPNFKSQLFYFYNRLSILEYRVCMLIKCKFTPKEIAILVFRDKSTISNIRIRLNTKFFGVKGSATDFDKFILSL